MNNIFGERRPYLVARDFKAEAKHLQDQSQNDEVRELHRARVNATWRKDFHVSPFNSRKGSYSLLASDPLGPEMQGFQGLDVTINLFSSKGHPKLTARLFSEGEALDPYELSIAQKARFILNWFWVGSVTHARFAKESATLFYKRKLHVWYRPEPLKDSIGRPADRIEKLLEDVFRKYLRHLVEQSSAPIVVRYIPSGVSEATEELFTSYLATESTNPANEIKIKVLTPVFYSRFVHYAHDSEAFFCELAESCTIWTDKPEFLTKIFLKKASPPLHAANLIDYVCFQLIKNLRRTPNKIERPLTSVDKPSPPTKGVDIRDFRMSSMDAFVLGQEDISLKTEYRTMVVRLFVAERIVFGSTGLLGMMELVGRGGVSWVLAALVTQAIQAFS
ncbi:hypothetical protein NW762_004892 [Fusarium torreyae]|uniref:Cyclopropane-fatty-acyl-phospholipid synthase n=1 Tax=Fusarium torreyae TaxID=1237075 RepID=A0A9W8S7F1_9HYPO|nr:hypothetical protein NW762_004892 [Fusarium torreyae]